MPRTVVTEPMTEVVVDTRVRGVVQITKDGEMWNCAVAIYNSSEGLAKATLTAEQVVELFQACKILQPTESADSHIIEFVDGPAAEAWAGLGFKASV